jgi:hypothetical protein
MVSFYPLLTETVTPVPTSWPLMVPVPEVMTPVKLSEASVVVMVQVVVILKNIGF